MEVDYESGKTVSNTEGPYVYRTVLNVYPSMDLPASWKPSRWKRIKSWLGWKLYGLAVWISNERYE